MVRSPSYVQATGEIAVATLPVSSAPAPATFDEAYAALQADDRVALDAGAVTYISLTLVCITAHWYASFYPSTCMSTVFVPT